MLFDMDGVVIDSEPLYQQGELRLFEEYGVSVPESDWALFRGSTEEGFYKLVRDRYHIREDAEILRIKGREYVLEVFAEKLDYMSGFEQLAHRMREQFAFGLVTATPRDLFEYVDKKLNLRRYFSQIVWGGMTRQGKPHPEPYLKMMEMMNVSPSECVVIEDSIHGIRAGLNAGAGVIALTGSVPVDQMPPAHKVIRHLAEITPELLSSIDNRPI